MSKLWKSAVFFAAIGLALAVVLVPWWTGEFGAGRIRVFPSRLSLCSAGTCHTANWQVLSSEAELWAKIGVLLFAVSLVSAGISLLALGAGALQAIGGEGKEPDTLWWLASVGAVFTVVLSGIFYFLRPESAQADLSLAYGTPCVVLFAVLLAFGCMRIRSLA